jgi:uncharacterized protein involved in exopolysaccharide biosynthesis
MATNPRAQAPPADGGDDEFDSQQLKEVVGFLLRAPRRRPRLAAAIFVITLVVGLVLVKYWPRTYTADLRILAQRNLVLGALDKGLPHDPEAPTKNATDAILRQDNLVALTKQLDLVDRWEATRQPAARLKDTLFGLVGTPKTDDDKLHDLIGLLAKKLTVFSDDSSITIAIEWPDRETAFDIVSLVQKNFLEARYDTSVNVIVEAIRILDERAKPQAAEVDAALAELMKIEAERAGGAIDVAAPGPVATTTTAPRPSTGAARPAASAPASGDSDLARDLVEVRRRIRVVTEDHDRQLSEAQRQLLDARTTLGPMHPTVVGLNEKIAELTPTPAELKTLDARERELVAQLAAPAPGASDATPGTARPQQAVPASTPPPVVRRPVVDLRDDTKTVVARQKLATASTKYNELLSRIEAAKIELEVTRAAFKYQYTLVRPPELPRSPSKPNAPLLLVATILLSLLLTVLVPGGVDLWRGRLMEPWQVERRLKLPILGDLTSPP